MSDETDLLKEAEARIESWREKDRREAEEGFLHVKAILLENGIAEAHVHYEGSGDSGDYCIAKLVMLDGKERPSATQAQYHYGGFGEDTEPVDIVILNQTYKEEYFDEETETWGSREAMRNTSLADLLIDVACAFVSRWHGGWENNDGGRGEVLITPTNVTVDHTEYFTESTSYSHTYDPAAMEDE